MRLVCLRVVMYVPYHLGIYEVTYKGATLEIEMEDANTTNALAGVSTKQREICAIAREAFGVRWIDNFHDLKIKRLKDSERLDQGCGCECNSCYDLNIHCRNRSADCKI